MMYGIKLHPYSPSDEDLSFTTNLINSLKDGGQWGIPRCALIYQKIDDKHMKLVNYLIPELAEHMVAEHMVAEGMFPDGMEKPPSVDDLKRQQADDHNAFKACCKKLGIEVDDSILDDQGDR